MSDSNDGASGGGFLAGIGDSIRAHVDERLKSPFAGALLLSLVVLHWKDFLILAFSSRSIEARIAIVSYEFSWVSSLLCSIGLAFAIAVTFYLLSATFLVFVELYEVLKGWIERKFDAVRWVSPTDYMASKKRNGEYIKSLQELAADNLTALDAEKRAVQDAVAESLRIQEQLNEARSQLSVHAQDKIVAEQRRAHVVQTVNSVLRNVAMVSDRSTSLEIDYQRILNQIASLRDYLDVRGLLGEDSLRFSIQRIIEEMSGVSEGNKEFQQRSSWMKEELETVPSVLSSAAS